MSVTPAVDHTELPVARTGVLPSYFIRAWHRAQERLRDPARRAAVGRLIGKLRPAPRGVASMVPADQHDAIRRDGIAFFPEFLSAGQARELHDLLAKFDCQDPWRPALGRWRLDQAPPDVHVADIPAAPTLLALQRLALDPRLVEIATAYFGGKPYLDSIQAWWSMSGNHTPQEAENFHRDNDSIRFLKFFLYLTDVDAESGPHKFVRASHREARLLERRRHTDEEVVAAFGAERVLEICGRAGDAFIEDTFGLHKGQLPKSRIRLLAQFRYSITPTVFRSPIVVGVSPAPENVTSLLHVV